MRSPQTWPGASRGSARVRNPSGRTPEALNAALAGLPAEAEVVVRVDGHGILEPDYVRTAVELLEQTGAANVGGVMHAEGVTTFERAVAAAMTSRLGVGNAAFHTGGAAGPADTVYLGVFRREWLSRMGGYDERFIRAQDWELNHRIRSAGGLVWFSPQLRVDLPPPSHAARPRPAVPRLRPLAPGRGARAPRDHQRCATSPRRPPWCWSPAARSPASSGPRRGCCPPATSR